MKQRIWLVLTALLCGAILVVHAAQSAATPPVKPSGPSNKMPPGVEVAQAISTITGVAISPLLGVGAVGAWKYAQTPGDKRSQLPWFAQPYFWLPALLLVAAVFAKDVLGITVPTALKKPFDVAEVFENKVSALIATGAFVPLIATVFYSAAGADASLIDGAGLAVVDLSRFYNILLIPFAMAAFVIVWLVSHVINVLILVSPFGTVDAALKSARLFLLSTVAVTSFVNPYAGAVWSAVIIIVSFFLVGWSFRVTVFGSVFAWDLLTLGHRRFKPDPTANWMFTAREINKVPVRTYGKLVRDAQGQLALTFRPWLILPARTLTLPGGRYAIGRGLLYPELLHVEGESARAVLDLPPRYRTHEEDLIRIYALAGIQDVGVIKGFKAIGRWLKELFGLGSKTAALATA